MRPIATDVARSVASQSVYLCVDHMDVPAKTAEPIEMPLVRLTG